jgi:uncharacterized membrane protein HdeD (DUF308 family)
VDAIAMLQIAVVLLTVAALGGIAMAAQRFARKANPPAWLSMLHGFLVAAALALVLAAAFGRGVPPLALAALGLFAFAGALGVLLNLRYQWKQRLLPAGLVVAHALFAVAGFGCLVLAAFNSA